MCCYHGEFLDGSQWFRLIELAIFVNVIAGAMKMVRQGPSILHTIPKLLALSVRSFLVKSTEKTLIRGTVQLYLYSKS